MRRQKKFIASRCLTLQSEKEEGPSDIPLFLSSHLFLSLFFFFPSFFLPSFLFLLVSYLIHFNSSMNPWLLVKFLEIFFFCKYLLSIFFYIIKSKKKLKKKIKIMKITNTRHKSATFQKANKTQQNPPQGPQYI